MADDTSGYVLDSFALLAYFADEPGAETVEHLLRQAQEQTITLHLSLINLGEVFTSPNGSAAKTKPPKPWRLSIDSPFNTGLLIVRSC